VWDRIRSRLSYANVMSTVAVFVAIGGSSYAAITLPRNSVGDRQLKSRAVGGQELKRGAVGSRALRNGGIRTADISTATRSALSGKPGPAGPAGPPAIALRAAISPTGGLVAGNATGTQTAIPNKRLIDFSRDLTGCVPTATLARNPGEPAVDPGPGRIVVAVEGNRVAVETYRGDGAPEHLPFNLVVAC
jgi:hypothetical protein